MYGGGKKPRKRKIIKKQSKDNIIKNVRHLFRLKKENDVCKNITIRDMKSLLEQEGDCYKVRVGNFHRDSFIEYESYGDEIKIY